MTGNDYGSGSSYGNGNGYGYDDKSLPLVAPSDLRALVIQARIKL